MYYLKSSISKTSKNTYVLEDLSFGTACHSMIVNRFSGREQLMKITLISGLREMAISWGLRHWGIMMLLFWPGVILAWSDGDDTLEALEGGLRTRTEFMGVVMAGGQWVETTSCLMLAFIVWIILLDPLEDGMIICSLIHWWCTGFF